MALRDDNQSDVETEVFDDGLTVSAAAKRMEALSDDMLGITAPSSARKKPAPRPRVEEEDDETHTDRPRLEDEDDDEETHTESEAEHEDDDEGEEEDDAEGDDPEDEDDDEESEQSANPEGKKLYKVIADGEEQRVPFKELLAGYSRTSVFTKKSQKLADERRAFDAAITAKNSETRALQEHYTAQLAALEEVLSQKEPDWEAVRKENPDQFAEVHAAWQIHKTRIEKITAERENEVAKLNAQQAKAHGDFVLAERKKLETAVPEWADQTEKGAKHRSAVRAFGLKHGFTATELDGIADHRSMSLLNKAYLYDLSQAEKSKNREKGKKRVENAPLLRPGTKQGRPSKRRNSHTRAAARLRKTGDVRDAAKAIEGLLD